MKHYLMENEDVLSALSSSSQKGLSENEAALRLESNGRNKLIEGKKKNLFQKIIAQIKDPMVLVLVGAAVVSFITALIEGETPTDVFIILSVVVLNTVLGIVQEGKAEKAIDALKEMAAATSKVIRDGRHLVVKSEELVPGDIVILEAGDAVPADGRIIDSASLKIEEAALTGESVPSDKFSDTLSADINGDIPLGDRKNMCYMGSVVVYGRGAMVVTATGMHTEMGKIATAITQAEDGETPLQKRLSQLSKLLTKLVLGICVFMFAFTLIRNGKFDIHTTLDTFMLAVSLAVAAIPEGLASVVTIVLSMGVTKMSKQKAIIRRLTAVETLGCTQIICSDKTGTLTQNKMTVVDFWSAREAFLAEGMALCSDAEPDDSGEAIGEPTECALVNYATRLGLKKENLIAKSPRIGEVPFDSGRKMMSTVHKNGDEIIQYTKGAPDELLARCSHILYDGKTIELTDELRNEVLLKNTEFASQALRVLACAYKMHSQAPDVYTSDALENNMVFIGLVGMIDPVRPEVTAAVNECFKAGIRPIMITGDHKDTAVAIAKTLGIITDASEAITGAEIDKFTDDEFNEIVTRYTVYARVQPEHKVRIVNAWRKKGCVTAMTGDGVNDAPSIKNADIGIGMGITGTDVTKNVADMILSDDNFATIVSAVAEGRRIFDNICKCIQFLLSSNLSEVMSIFIATLCGFTILKPAHILFINLVTDSLPALALGAEKAESDIMTRKPRKSDEGIFANGLGFNVVYQGIMVSVITLAAYFIGHYMESGVWEITQSPHGMTMAFLAMSMTEIFHSFNMRSHGSIFKIKHQNMLLLGTMILSLILTTALIFVPSLRNLFDFEVITILEYLTALLLALSSIPVVEIVKLIQRRK
ncbi:MAG: calcium-translocating P-type ATPase, PMCA-type [Ruminococcaceae bacterium]|nr:calcium-translocating P-type ATPase, PMCA-type [Oscillospiraceae bacterium]